MANIFLQSIILKTYLFSKRILADLLATGKMIPFSYPDLSMEFCSGLDFTLNEVAGC